MRNNILQIIKIIYKQRKSGLYLFQVYKPNLLTTVLNRMKTMYHPGIIINYEILKMGWVHQLDMEDGLGLIKKTMDSFHIKINCSF